jgi:hypothetical protein
MITTVHLPQHVPMDAPSEEGSVGVEGAADGDHEQQSQERPRDRRSQPLL